MDQVKPTECYVPGPNHLKWLIAFFKFQINYFLSGCAKEQIRNSLGNLDSEFILEMWLRTLATITHMEYPVPMIRTWKRNFSLISVPRKAMFLLSNWLLLFCGYHKSMFLFQGNSETSMKPTSTNCIVLALYIFMYLPGFKLFSLCLNLFIIYLILCAVCDFISCSISSWNKSEKKLEIHILIKYCLPLAMISHCMSFFKNTIQMHRSLKI